MASAKSSTIVLLMAIMVVLAACANQPFTEGPQVAIGIVENSPGDEYTVSAEQLTVDWTFTEEAPFTVSFNDGVVSYKGVNLVPGCYSGESTVDAVLGFDEAEEAEFATPDRDPACADLPA